MEAERPRPLVFFGETTLSQVTGLFGETTLSQVTRLFGETTLSEFAGRKTEEIDFKLSIPVTSTGRRTVLSSALTRTGIFEIACDLLLIWSDFILSEKGTVGILTGILDTGDPCADGEIGRILVGTERLRSLAQVTGIPELSGLDVAEG
jgi:hypothetical protein